MNVPMAKARIRQATEDFLQVCKDETLACSMGNNASELRALAEMLHNASESIKSRLSGMQGKLNGQAFGRE